MVDRHTPALANTPVIQRDLSMPYLAYPYRVSGRNIPTTIPAEDHLRDLILQVLFTNPGERVNLPEFGIGVERFLFEPSNDALHASMEFIISANLQRWLGDRLSVDQVTATSESGYEETITITIDYTISATQQRQSLQVQV